MNTCRQTANSIVKSTKIGRNDTCPCGSGKKYKKCCGQDNGMLESQYETMKQIAYMSEIGRRREAFCLFMTHRMQTYHREVAEGALDGVKVLLHLRQGASGDSAVRACVDVHSGVDSGINAPWP